MLKVSYTNCVKNKLQLYIINASGSLDRRSKKITNAFDKASHLCSDVLRLDKVDVICIDDPNMTIPEVGVGGYTPNRHLVYLYIDSEKIIGENEIFSTLCHEFHHAKRYDGPGYGQTLFDSMIFEGLAVAFERECAKNKGFFSKELLKRKHTELLLDKYYSKFSTSEFDYFTWFIYDKTAELPRWTGYEIGYYIVRKYLEAKNKKASELALEDSSKFQKFTSDTLRGD